MAEESSAADETPVTFNIKSSSDAKYVLTIPLTTTVADLKQKLSTDEYASIPPDRQRLIYSGRILKDPDTLASYKIKEGNTIHLVKGAASNQRQNPANQGSSASATGSGAAAQGVPQNLAAGTGRDPLAALTGARYAGFAQMPNANMFGPDGGMGPPPDPEHMASMLENPNFASTLNEALSNPDVIDQMIRSNPMFQGPMGQQARQMLQDPNFRRMMTDPTTLRQMNEMRRNMPGLFGGMGGMGGLGAAGGGDGGFPMPGPTDTAPATGEENGNTAGTTGQGTNPSSSPPPNPFAMFGGPPGTAAGGNPFAALYGGLGAGQGQNQAGSDTNTATTGEANRDNPSGQTGTQQPTNPSFNPFAALLQNPQLMQSMLAAIQPPSNAQNPTPSADGSSNLAAAATTPQNPFAALQALQQMQQQLGAGAGGAGGAGSPNANDPNAMNNPFAFLMNNPAALGAFGGGPPLSPQPEDNRPPEDRYAEQLRQLNEMGFYEFERNVEALRRTGGSVQGAVEYLLTH